MCSKIALTNVRVFNGYKLTAPMTVVIDGGLIGADDTGAKIEDCAGAVLLPGLIDAHIHLSSMDDLVDMARYGVTTGLDMATWPVEKLNSLRGHMGMTDIRSAGIPASAPGGSISRLVPEDAIITDTEKAITFVENRIKDGSDYIKIVADIPGSSPEILNTITQEAHKHGKMVITHAATL